MAKMSRSLLTDEMAFVARLNIDRSNVIINAIKDCRLNVENKEILEELLVRLITDDLELVEEKRQD